ncbi:MAG TPA: hypothetical protein VFX80_01650 [Solirubrobacteraceae bacterium]|nr:hypothetical protein [Solirubrobacteraceae bacterium]
MARTAAAFKRLSPTYKALVALVAPIGTIIATLLALNVIQPFGEDAFAAGVDRTAEAATAAVNVRVTADDLAFDAAGDFDYRAGQGSLQYDFSRTPGSESLTGIDTVYSRGQVYMRLGAGARPWIHADLATAHEDLANFTEAAGLDAPPPELASLSALDFTDPSRALAELRRAAEVEEIGTETIFSVPTRGYRGVVPPDEEGGRELTATAWIGADDLIRRLELEGDGLELRIDFTEFGKPVDVEVPATGRVQKLGDVLDRLLEQQLA